MKKVNSIQILSIISFVFWIIGLINFLLTISYNNYLTSIFFFISISVGAIIALVGSIMILAINFENQKINDLKILWGILSLLLLGPIGMLIFSIIAKKVGSNNQENTQIGEEFSNKTDYLDIINQAFKMVGEGSITKEEFDIFKDKNLPK